MNYVIGVSNPLNGVLVISPTYGWLTLLAFLILASGALWLVSKPRSRPPQEMERHRQREYPDAA